MIRLTVSVVAGSAIGTHLWFSVGDGDVRAARALFDYDLLPLEVDVRNLTEHDRGILLVAQDAAGRGGDVSG